MYLVFMLDCQFFGRFVVLLQDRSHQLFYVINFFLQAIAEPPKNFRELTTLNVKMGETSNEDLLPLQLEPSDPQVIT